MLFDAMAMILAAAAISLVPGARAAPCPKGTVSVNLTSSGDMQGLIDAMNCSGAGVYDVTVHGRLQIGEILKVSERKNVTVTGYVGTAMGSASDTDSALGSTSDSYAVLDAGNKTGMFLVSEGSTLTINKLILEGGFSEDGAAIAVTSSSTLKVFDCDFTNNTASMSGGENIISSIHIIKVFIETDDRNRRLLLFPSQIALVAPVGVLFLVHGRALREARHWVSSFAPRSLKHGQYLLFVR